MKKGFEDDLRAGRASQIPDLLPFEIAAIRANIGSHFAGKVSRASGPASR
jgi:hypothetical protein